MLNDFFLCAIARWVIVYGRGLHANLLPPALTSLGALDAAILYIDSDSFINIHQTYWYS